MIARHREEMAQMTAVIDKLKARTDQLTSAVANIKSTEIKQFTTQCLGRQIVRGEGFTPSHVDVRPHETW